MTWIRDPLTFDFVALYCSKCATTVHRGPGSWLLDTCMFHTVTGTYKNYKLETCSYGSTMGRVDGRLYKILLFSFRMASYLERSIFLIIIDVV